MTNTCEPEHILLLNDHGRPSRMARAAFAAGVVGPIILGMVIGALSIVQYRFMRELGWHPITAPTTDWPSGLALGPHGWIMIVAFVGSGSLLIVFAVGIHQTMPITGGPVFLGLAGFGMMLLGFKTDPTYRTTPATVHGMLHDIAFVIMGLSFLAAFVSFGYGLRRYQGWHGFARYSWLSALVVVPAIAVKGLMFYVFLLNTLAWVAYIAFRLRRLTTH